MIDSTRRGSAAQVKVTLGQIVWTYDDCTVQVDRGAGSIHIFMGQPPRRVATAPLALARVEWQDEPRRAAASAAAPQRVAAEHPEMWYT
jgi:hypothetical protein